jgi:hypothetical protein
MKIGASEEDLRRAVYTPRKQAREFHKSIKAEAELKYLSGLELIAKQVRVRLDLPQPQELPLAVGQSVPRINQWSQMAREQAAARRNNLSPVEVGPVQGLEDLDQQRRKQTAEEVDLDYERTQRMLRLLD